jgi:hypothetical protein
MNDNRATANKQKAEIAALVAKLKAKQAEMLEAHQNIVSAQQELDDYIQFRKTDEVAHDQLAGIVGFNQRNYAIGD